MSGEADRTIVEQLLAEGADDVIPKPFDRLEFAHIVRSTLQRRRLARRVKAIKLSLNHVSERSECLDLRSKSEFGNGSSVPPSSTAGEIQTLLPRLRQSFAMKQAQLKEGEVDLIDAMETARDQMRRRLYKML
jgi:DNA-binding response OmpR family regulator